MPYRMGAHSLAKAFRREGVDCIFTLCGGHIMPIYEACLDEGIRIIDVRHEQAAAFAADAWGRMKRRPGVAVVTAGPGITNTVTAVANAFKAGTPLVVIGGQAPLLRLGKGDLQELDALSILRPITCWAARAWTANRLAEMTHTAFHEAMSRRGPVFLEVPMDVLLEPAGEESPQMRPGPMQLHGEPSKVKEAAQLLATAERPVLMGGSDLWWSGAEESLMRFLEVLPLPVYLNAMGRGMLPPDHPCFFALSRGWALREADVVLLIGTPMDFRLNFGRAFGEKAKIVQVDRNPGNIGQNREVTIGIWSDARPFLELVAEEIAAIPHRRSSRFWVEAVRQIEQQRRQERIPLEESEAIPIHPLRLARELADVCSENTIFVGDGGDVVSIAATIIHPYRPGHWLDPGPMGTLGMGVPFALASKLAYPEKEVIALFGDGAIGFSIMEYDTAVRHGIPFIGIVGNNGQWAQIRYGQVSMFGEERAVATKLRVARYEQVVEALGGYGEYIEDPREIRPALERARASGKPALLNVRLDETYYSDATKRLYKL